MHLGSVIATQKPDYTLTNRKDLSGVARRLLIPQATKHIICFSGLRGAVSFACAYIFSDVNGNRSVTLLKSSYSVSSSVAAYS
jgi:hypothetical protein